jgi:hypothetical protein
VAQDLRVFGGLKNAFRFRFEEKMPAKSTRIARIFGKEVAVQMAANTRLRAQVIRNVEKYAPVTGFDLCALCYRGVRPERLPMKWWPSVSMHSATRRAIGALLSEEKIRKGGKRGRQSLYWPVVRAREARS